MTKGVEAQLVVATASLLLIAVINLYCGLPQTHTNRQSLFSFLISKPDLYAVPSSGKSYAVPRKKGEFMASASEVVKVLNEGIDAENRMLGLSPEEAFARKISKYNLSLPDVRVSVNSCSVYLPDLGFPDCS